MNTHGYKIIHIGDGTENGSNAIIIVKANPIHHEEYLGVSYTPYGFSFQIGKILLTNFLRSHKEKVYGIQTRGNIKKDLQETKIVIAVC